MGFLLAQVLSGLTTASELFLVAAGLSLIFGVTKVINFAHGTFAMLGGYTAYSLAMAWQPALGLLGFWLAVPVAALAVAALGALIEVAVLKRIYRAPILYPLLATFGVVLLLQDGILALWGPEQRSAGADWAVPGSLSLLGQHVPAYDLVLIALAPAVLVALQALLRRSRFGQLIRAAREDRDMLAALGVNQALLFTGVFALGAGLAGLGGALQVPRETLHLGMDLALVVEAFVVVVIGGMGSLPGAFLAALLIGQVHALGVTILPQASLVFMFAAMAVVLVLRPQGLLGTPEVERRDSVAVPVGPRAWPPGTAAGATALVLAGLAALPAVLGSFWLAVATEALIVALFAASIQLVTGIGGMITFGHAAYFGLGAYGAALTAHHLGWPMSAALAAGPATAALGAAVLGWFCARLAGVYFAMLTLAVAQLVWTLAFLWVPVTGGDNGLLGLWPAAWADGPARYYWLTLVLSALAWLGLRGAIAAPVGFALRAQRDEPERAAALGLNRHARHWAALVVSGGVAGLAGALFVFLKGSVFPAVAALETSVDGLVAMLLGGLHSPAGPALGAGVLVILKTELLTQTDYWRAVMGALILAITIGLPHGLGGAAGALRRRLRRQLAAWAERAT